MIGRRPFLAGLAASIALPAAARRAHRQQQEEGFPDFGGESVEDMLEAFDRDVDADLAAFDREIDAFFARLERELAAIWGEEAAILPEKTRWAGYADGDWRTRILVDYEKGELVVESLDPAATEDSLRARLNGFLADDGFGAFDGFAKELQALVDGVDGFADQQAGGGGKDLVRRAIPKGAQPRYAQVPTRGGPVQRIVLDLSPDRDRLLADDLAPLALAEARRYGLDPALVFSIIKNESSFNPRAVSHVPAFGLMQLVPSSGGRDAYKLVRGEDAAPSPDLLFDPAWNVRLGTAYLHILDSRYLRAMRDPQTRQHCVIAAYNTGAGNVARALVGANDVRAAARVANAQSPDAVYSQLRASLPYEETRAYLRKVSRDIPKFAKYRQL